MKIYLVTEYHKGKLVNFHECFFDKKEVELYKRVLSDKIGVCFVEFKMEKLEPRPKFKTI